MQRESQIKNTLNAFYTDVEFTINENLTANAGMRYELNQFSGVGDHGSFGNDLGLFPQNTADDNVEYSARRLHLLGI